LLAREKKKAATKDKRLSLLREHGWDGSNKSSELVALMEIALESFQLSVATAKRFLAFNPFVVPETEGGLIREATTKVEGHAIHHETIAFSMGTPSYSALSNPMIQFTVQGRGIVVTWMTPGPQYKRENATARPEEIQKWADTLKKAGFQVPAHEVAEALRTAPNEGTETHDTRIVGSEMHA
jgi:hypothetical protein